MPRHRLLLVCCACLFVSINAQAAMPSSDHSLEHWIKASLENNPRIQSAYHQWKSKQAMSAAAGSLPDPSLTIDYFIDEVQTRTGPQQYRLMLVQKLPWFGKRQLDADIAGQAADAAHHQMQLTRLQLTRQLTHLWADGVFLESDTQLTRENLALLEQIERIARTGYRLARASHPDLIRIQLQRSKLENQLTALESQRLELVSRLAAFSGQQVDPAFAWPKAFPPLAALAGEETLRQQLLTANPTLAALRLQSDIRANQAQVAQLQGRPDFTLRYGRIFTEKAINPGIDGSGDDPQYVGLGVNIPLWVAKTQHLENAAHEAKMESELQIKDAELRLGNELDSSLFQFRNTEQQLERYRVALIPQAENALTTLLKAYQTGTSNFSDLLETEKLLLDLKKDQANLKRIRWKAHADIQALIGHITR